MKTAEEIYAMVERNFHATNGFPTFTEERVMEAIRLCLDLQNPAEAKGDASAGIVWDDEVACIGQPWNVGDKPSIRIYKDEGGGLNISWPFNSDTLSLNCGDTQKLIKVLDHLFKEPTQDKKPPEGIPEWVYKAALDIRPRTDWSVRELQDFILKHAPKLLDPPKHTPGKPDWIRLASEQIAKTAFNDAFIIEEIGDVIVGHAPKEKEFKPCVIDGYYSVKEHEGVPAIFPKGGDEPFLKFPCCGPAGYKGSHSWCVMLCDWMNQHMRAGLFENGRPVHPYEDPTLIRVYYEKLMKERFAFETEQSQTIALLTQQLCDKKEIIRRLTT